MLVTSGCQAGGTNLQEAYGNDASYFMGLNALANNDEDNADRLLKDCVAKGSPLIARRAAEKSATLGSVQERIKKYRALYAAYHDDDALLLTCRELNKDEEYAQIIQLTDELDISTCNNELAYYRINALHEKNDTHFENEFETWCLLRQFSAEQYKLFSKVQSPTAQITFRSEVYRQDYGSAYEKVRSICNETDTNIYPQLISDAGKVYLYGSGDYLHNAYFFDSLAKRVTGEGVFYAHFYAGRLFERADNSDSAALSRFKKAMEATSTAKNYDNALWYYLNTELKESITDAISGVQEYRSSWHDPSYFDDFFDTLSVRLLSQHLWSDFFQVAKLVDGYASDEVVSKYSYIAGRLVETGFLKMQNASIEQTTKPLYTRALSSGTDLYYRLIAADRLGLSGAELEKVICSSSYASNFKHDTDIERLLCGYADFGLGEYIYPEWQSSSDKVSIDCVKKIAGFLQQSGSGTNDFYAKSLRIAAKKFNSCETKPDEDMLKLVYPQDFHEAATDACKRFSTPEYLLYALIRSESFFDPQIVSHAGASGLTQLMGSTAADIARKLKMSDYDLDDSTTNILFGCYYLEEMRRRLDGSSILALFAYNGGITRVRTWVNSANLEFGTNALPKDLFLEALPFAETREYGRKVVSAAAMYGYLYYGKTPGEVIDEILE